MSADESETLLERAEDGTAASASAAEKPSVNNYATTIVLAVLSIIFACGAFLAVRLLPIFLTLLTLFRGERWQWVGMVSILLVGPMLKYLRGDSASSKGIATFLSTPTALLVALLPIWFGADPSADYGFCNAAVFVAMAALLYGVRRFGAMHWSPWAGPGTPMRIMLVGDSFEPKVDGVSTFTTHTIKELIKMGHSVCVVTSVGTAETLHGAQVIRLPGIGIELHKGHSLTLPSLKMLEALRDFKPNCLHIFEGCIPIGFYTGLLCRMLGVPHVSTQHTRIDLYWKRYLPFIPEWIGDNLLMMIFAAAYSEASVNLAVCADLMNYIAPAVGAHKVALWVSGCATGSFREDNFSDEMRGQLSVATPDLPLVLHVGRLAAEKQTDDLPGIFAEVMKLMNGKVRFAVVGDGHVREEMEKECVALGVPVYFSGFLRGPDLFAAYASGDVFVSACVTEAFPLCYLEAMSSGVAVVGPNAGGVPATFDDDVHGFLYEAGDSDAAAAAIVRAIEQKERLVKAAVPHARSFTWARSVGELEQCYKVAATPFISDKGAKL